jgi:hypothetical protein
MSSTGSCCSGSLWALAKGAAGRRDGARGEEVGAGGERPEPTTRERPSRRGGHSRAVARKREEKREEREEEDGKKRMTCGSVYNG